MKKATFTLIILFLQASLNAQVAFHNFGEVQIHEMGNIGFHTNVINNGTFDNNDGLAGFYHNTESLTVSGSNAPIFNDMEIDVVDDLFLEVAVGVTNFQEFINGSVITPRETPLVSLDYINDAPYLGENDDRHVDGYASATGILDFSFPIGDDLRLRPMRIDNQAAVNTARGAYFFENPNTPNFFSGSFDTTSLSDLLYGVSIFEFWDLNGDTATRATLTWDDNSNIPTLVDNLENLRVVGWDSALQQWVNLGSVGTSGDFDNGEITSEPFIPNQYTVITFGSSEILLDGDLEIFTAVSPNGDGINDTFTIQGLSQFPNNEVSIFNRWGVEVFNKEQYHVNQETEGFGGVSEGRVTILKEEELPVGTYFYTLKINGQKARAGYLYINK